MKKYCIAAVLMLIGSPLMAMGFQLSPNKWETLVVPGDPEGWTIGQLFGDDLESLEYKTEWIIYVYDASAGNYTVPDSLESELKAGQGFWIIQTSDDVIELDLPAGIQDADNVADATCGDGGRCFPVSLPGSGEAGTSFNLVGAPYSQQTPVGNYRFVTESEESRCAAGCDLSDAREAEYSQSFFYVYNSGSNEYDEFGTGSTLQPWQGFWVASLPAAQEYSRRLNIPFDIVEPPVGGQMCSGGLKTAASVTIPKLAKPDYMQPYNDPALGALVTRITESNRGQVQKPVYSTIQAWNADESYILLYRTGVGGASHFLLDGQNYEPVEDLPIAPSDLEEVFWSHSDPDMLYYVDAADSDKFKSYSVRQRESTTIKDFRSVCSGGVTAGNDVQMQSIDDDLFAFRCQGVDGQSLMLSYRISTDEIKTARIGDGTRWGGFTAPSPAPSGERFWFEGTALDTDLTTVQRELDLGNIAEHSNVGLTHNGEDGFYQVVFNGSPNGCNGDPDNGIGHFAEHNLETGECRTFFTQSQGYPYTTSSTHVSAQSYKEPGWVAVSSIGRPNQYVFFDNNEPAPALLSEIYLANTDPSNLETCRLAHHRSHGKAAVNGGDNYDAYFGEPHVTISPSGTRLLFGSDWYDSGSVDTFVIELPGFVQR